MGDTMEEQIMSIMTAAKYFWSIIPAESPFEDTISATSPRVIIPTPTLMLSLKLYFASFAVIPQPMIFVISATITKSITLVLLTR